MNNKILLIVIIIILNLISISIIINSLNKDCSKCQLITKTEKQSGVKLKEPFVIKIQIYELYNRSLNEECPISWSRTQGFYEK